MAGGTTGATGREVFCADRAGARRGFYGLVATGPDRADVVSAQGQRYGFRVPWPPLLFLAVRHTLYCAALAHADRPEPETPLFHAPLMNIDAQGAVCLGTAETPPTCSLDQYAGGRPRYAKPISPMSAIPTPCNSTARPASTPNGIFNSGAGWTANPRFRARHWCRSGPARARGSLGCCSPRAFPASPTLSRVVPGF